jgi:hypothetical protein
VTVPLTATGVPNMTIADNKASATSGPAATITTHFATNDEPTFTVALLPATNPQSTGTLRVTITGADAGLFVKTADTCSAASLVKAPGTISCTLKVKYTGTGAHAATLTVSGTGVAGNSVSAALASP